MPYSSCTSSNSSTLVALVLRDGLANSVMLSRLFLRVSTMMCVRRYCQGINSYVKEPRIVECELT